MLKVVKKLCYEILGLTAVLSSGVLRYVAGFVVCDVSKECGSSIVRFKKSQNPA